MLLNIMSDADHVMVDTKYEMDVLFRTCAIYTAFSYLIFSSRIVRSGIFSVLTGCLLTDH